MNISRLNSAANAGSNAAGHIHRTDKSNVRPSAEIKAPAANAAAQSILPGDQHDAADMSPRLAAYTNKIDERISNAIATAKLSPRQVAALEDAKAKFHSMMERLDNAFGGEESADAKLPSVLAHIMDTMSHQVGAIMQNGKQPTRADKLERDEDQILRSERLRQNDQPAALSAKLGVHIDKIA